jgi:hypothetical protein
MKIYLFLFPLSIEKLNILRLFNIITYMKKKKRERKRRGKN